MCITNVTSCRLKCLSQGGGVRGFVGTYQGGEGWDGDQKETSLCNIKVTDQD